jgi:hypothetical protein
MILFNPKAIEGLQAVVYLYLKSGLTLIRKKPVKLAQGYLS